MYISLALEPVSYACTVEIHNVASEEFKQSRRVAPGSERDDDLVSVEIQACFISATVPSRWGHIEALQRDESLEI